MTSLARAADARERTRIEPIALRRCCDVRDASIRAGDWRIAQAQSLLGASLIGAGSLRRGRATAARAATVLKPVPGRRREEQRPTAPGWRRCMPRGAACHRPARRAGTPAGHKGAAHFIRSGAASAAPDDGGARPPLPMQCPDVDTLLVRSHHRSVTHHEVYPAGAVPAFASQYAMAVPSKAIASIIWRRSREGLGRLRPQRPGGRDQQACKDRGRLCEAPADSGKNDGPDRQHDRRGAETSGRRRGCKGDASLHDHARRA